MKKKVFSYNFIIAVAATLLTTLFASIFLYFHDSTQLKKSLSSEASHLKTGMDNMGTAYVDKIVLRSGHRVTLISEDGTVLFDSAIATGLNSHADREEVKEAIEAGIGEELRFSETMDRKTYYYAVRLQNRSIVRVSASAPSFFGSVLLLWWVPLFSLFVLLIFSWLQAKRLTQKIVQPINDIQLEDMETVQVFEELSPFAVKMQKEKKAIRKKLKKLKHKQVEFSAITEYMREGFLVLDTQATILSHNKSALILLDSDFPDAINRSILELNRSQILTNAVRDALNGKPQEFILPIGEKHCQFFANPVWYKNRSQGAVIVILDVTEKQEREKFRREFTANVSHELRTPLTSISGYAEIIANGVAKTEDTPKFAANIYKEAQRMIALIGDILFLSKLDENHSSLTKDNVNLLTICKEAVARLQDKAAKKNVTLHFTGDSSPITGIATVLDEIVFNIMDNAVKYNHENGEVTIKLENLGSEIKFTVADTGVGIPPAEQDRVFERFYRVDKSRESSAQSTGLGLSIVKHGAALHGAKIDLESDGKTGTTITVTFPV